MRFAALGRTRLMLESARRCMARHQLVLVGTARPAPEYQCDEEEFAALAHAAGCGFLTTARLDADHARLLRDVGAEAVISINWPTIMPGGVINACPHGVINAHVGDLPRYRGNATPNWAILQGEGRVVLTLHRMDDGLDSGPIMLQRAYALTPNTYVGDVYNFLQASVPEMFAEVLDRLEAGSLTPSSQRDDVAALRCLPRLPGDNEIDWNQSAEQIARAVRAAAEPFSGAFTFLNGQPLFIWKADADRPEYCILGVPGQVVERRQTGEVVVLTGDGVLVLREASYLDDRRRMPADIIRSARARLGLAVAAEIQALRTRIESLEHEVRRLLHAGQ